MMSMTTFNDFLHQRLTGSGFSTEDALACFLPLVRQVAAAHRAGSVAPLNGVNQLFADNGRLWYEDAKVQKPTLNNAKLREVEEPASRAMQVVNQFQVSMNVDAGTENIVSLQIGKRGDAITQPVYLPGFVGWEHEIGHHDPLTDIYVLGLILASLTCNLNLNEPADLERFVTSRRNLFDLNKTIHPVLAKAIVRMTELDRHRRPQDTSSLLRTLENYREQSIDLEFDLARLPTFEGNDRKGRRALILTCLQQRLFEISRRNRLLHFRPTMQTVNLTWASFPLSFDMRSIKPEQILTWNHDFRDAVTAGGQVSLNKYLRFEEALYLSSQLDGIRNEARRDQNEYGLAQLRLVVCFLRWANLKETPPERYDSPLVLLPVQLAKTKGVRDVFMLEPVGTEAEINPVLRHHLKQLYAVDLPEFIDLTQNSLEDLHKHLTAKVQASEPGVTIELIDKPRINIIHAKAQRRLEQYRRRARLSGRGVRTFLDLDYSYDRDNYHPLGLRLFQTRVAPPRPSLSDLIEETPRPRTHMVAADPEETKERRLVTQTADQTNPYHWEFDLCNVTLGNFHYRKMSLVRDYTTLLDRTEEHAGFDSIFSLQPRDALAQPAKPLPIDDSYPIVQCDPTQASAIALARTGRSFIIQGPPGTGKSQTITNLIADFVAQGKRVLFVCEKRAAIDVVFHRLEQSGLSELCCLIHDSQGDKKEFIFELKRTYEAFLETKETQAAKTEEKRTKLLSGLKKELAPLENWQAAQQGTQAAAGVALHTLLQRTIALREHIVELSPADRERIPPYQHWHANRERIERLREHLHEMPPDGVFARHPLRRLHSRFAGADQPIAAIQQALPSIFHLLDQLLSQVQPLGLPAECWNCIDRLSQISTYAGKILFLAETNDLSVLAAKSESAKKLTTLRRRYSTKEQELKRIRMTTSGWRQKPSPEETKSLLMQAREQENSIMRFVQPSFWRLRSRLLSAYNFAAHSPAISYSNALEKLDAEHGIAAELTKVETEAREEFGFVGTFPEFSAQVTALTDGVSVLPAFLQTLHRFILESPRDAEIVTALAQMRPAVDSLCGQLTQLLDDASELSLPQLQIEVKAMESALSDMPAFLPCFKEIAALPAPLAKSFRYVALRVDQMEAALALRTLDELLRADPVLGRFSAGVHSTQVGKIEELHDQLHDASAATVRDRVCRRFLDSVRVTTLAAAQLTPEQKERKPIYNKGRRELEHEFGKSMRFRSIRDLVDGETGEVLKDLKPVWLMSPLSVSDALPLSAMFDVVIFDEASQVTLEEAVPAIFRAKQVIVVGDEMQLPPTNFFGSKQDDEDDRVLIEDETGQEVEYDLGSSSLLNHSARNLASTMLGWHYRSRSESLISFSNAAFYHGRLLTVPEVALPPVGMREIAVATPPEGQENVKRLLERPVSFHILSKAVYEQRRNTAEADYIAHMVREMLARDVGLSLGVIAFSEAQQTEIEQALERLAVDDDAFRARLDIEREREKDGQFVGLLVKNLENIQGDERDIIILSVCYGPGPAGKMLMNFGPINQNGGERRLNVAFSRAKKHMAIVSSIRHSAITNDYNDGARAFKNYLRYAEAMSAGDHETGRRVLWEINPSEQARTAQEATDAVVAQLGQALSERGWVVEFDVGQSSFRCNLAVRAADERIHRLGILVDTEKYYQNDNVLERDVFRPRLLRNFGWEVTLVLTKDWLQDRDGVMSRIEGLLNAKRKKPR